MMTGEWVTPRGRRATFAYRENTSDWNTISSILTHDEYGIRGLDIETGTVWDIGAHLGAFTVAVLLDNPGASVVAVEPIPQNVELIEENLRLNGLLERCIRVSAVVGAPGAQGKVRFNYGGNETATHHAWIGNSTLVYEKGPEDQTYEELERMVASLDWMLSQFGDPVAVKIDCEGGEWDFLQGAGRARLPVIVGEAHPVQGHTAKDMVTALAGHSVTLDDPGNPISGFHALLDDPSAYLVQVEKPKRPRKTRA